MLLTLKSLPARCLQAIQAKEQDLATRYPWFRRRNYVLYKFQTKYAVAMVLLALFVTVTVGLMMYRLLRIGASDLLDDGDLMDANLRWLVGGLVLLIVTTFAALFVWVVVISHRVAGPLAVITRYLKELSEGHYPHLRPLRESDELKELFAHLKVAVDRMRDRDVLEAKSIAQAIDALAPAVSGASGQEALNGLKAVLEQKSSMLQPAKIQEAAPRPAE